MASVGRIVLEISATALVGASLLSLNLFGVPRHQPVLCSDTSIRYPYRESTVPSWTVFLFGVVFNVFMICLGEYDLFRRRLLHCPELVVFGKRVHPWLQSTYRWLVLFLFGYAATMLLTFIGKFSVGRLRPHFLSACNININDLCGGKDYIDEFDCSGDSHVLREARMSFPSGHSSGAFFPAVYLITYMHYRIHYPAIVKACIQLVVLCMAWYTALSRVADYKHHSTDVLAGVVLAIFMAFLTILGCGRIHQQQKSSDNSDFRDNLRSLQSATTELCTRIDIEPDRIVR